MLLQVTEPKSTSPACSQTAIGCEVPAGKIDSVTSCSKMKGRNQIKSGLLQFLPVMNGLIHGQASEGASLNCFINSSQLLRISGKAAKCRGGCRARRLVHILSAMDDDVYHTGRTKKGISLHCSSRGARQLEHHRCCRGSRSQIGSPAT